MVNSKKHAIMSSGITAAAPTKRLVAPFARRAQSADTPGVAKSVDAHDRAGVVSAVSCTPATVPTATTADANAVTRQATAALSSEARQRILALPKKRTIAMVTDTADALQRVESSEATKRVAPTVTRESASGFVPAPTQPNGTTPAMRAMRRSQNANAARYLGYCNIVAHFVMLQKLLQHATTGAILSETALDLARTGQY